MLDKIKDLIDVKSIVTILLTLVVAYKAIVGDMEIQELYLMIIAFYFGTQHQKNSSTENLTDTTENTEIVEESEEKSDEI